MPSPPAAGYRAAAVSLAAAEEVGGRWHAPDRAFGAAPDLRPLWAVAMPRARVEIAELFALHLVEFGVELDHPVVGIAMERRDVVAGPEPQRSPDQRDLALAQKIAADLQVRE